MTYKLHKKLAINTQEVISCKKPELRGLNLTGGFPLSNFFIELCDFLFHQRAAMCCQFTNLIFAKVANIHRRQHLDNRQTIIESV